jgi:molecular chaperone DnaK (HSP70)
MLIPDPCFIESIRRASGSKRVLVHVANGTGAAVAAEITDVRKPEWLDIEGAMLGDTLTIKKGGKLPLVVNINTDHRFFPEEKQSKEEIRIEFKDQPPLTIYLYLQEIISTVESFRGTFAMDFGTTNTCYAWKARVGDRMQMSDVVKPPEASREIPTLVRFKDISNRGFPLIEIGNHARDYIARNAGRTQQYVISVKRLLGLDKELTILDDRSGMEPGRFQRYKPEEIAGAIIAELLKEAESKIGQRIESVIATFPILYNRKKQDALRRAFRHAFEALNREWRDDRLVLRLDETNAAAFNYVYGQLMDQFRRFSVQTAKHRLLSYDYGGGTIDVSLLDVDLSRDTGGKVTVQTKMLGITGDAALGGDIVTLTVLRLLKSKLALRIAQTRLEDKKKADAAAAAASQSAVTANNPWAFTAAAAAPKPAAGDPWASLAAADDKAAADAKPVEELEEDPATADIQNLVPENRQAKAWEVLAGAADVVEVAAQKGCTLLAAVEQLCAAGQRQLAEIDKRELAVAVEDAIDLLLPTKWKTLESNGDLITKETARKLFYELWLPAEVLKIKAVSDASRIAKLTEPLHRIAKYAGVKPEQLEGVTVSEAEINAAIEPALRRSVGKAAHLLQSAPSDAPAAASTGGGLSFGSLLGAPAAAVPDRPVTVLLAGNGARLPLVRQLVSELCQVDPANVVMDPKGVKATVAQGACEEHILRRDFGGEGGLIRYDAGDFTTRVPYTIGLFHKELALLGFAGGFAPVLPRATAVDSQVLLTEALQVVHKGATELPVYAWFHDHRLGGEQAGKPVEPTSLGWFDLTRPESSPWEGMFTAEIHAQIQQAGNAFCLVLVMDKNRELTLVRPDRTAYKLNAATEAVDDSEYPFSGVH